MSKSAPGNRKSGDACRSSSCPRTGIYPPLPPFLPSFVRAVHLTASLPVRNATGALGTVPDPCLPGLRSEACKAKRHPAELFPTPRTFHLDVQTTDKNVYRISIGNVYSKRSETAHGVQIQQHEGAKRGVSVQLELPADRCRLVFKPKPSGVSSPHSQPTQDHYTRHCHFVLAKPVFPLGIVAFA